MILRNSFNFISQFLINTTDQVRKIYLNSNFYDNKISKIHFKDLIYKPSPHLLSSLIKYQTKKIIQVKLQFNIKILINFNLFQIY